MLEAESNISQNSLYLVQNLKFVKNANLPFMVDNYHNNFFCAISPAFMRFKKVPA